MLIGVPMVYGQLGKGVEFFPNVEPDTGVVLVHARGNLSLAEKDRLVRSVESRLLGMKELSTVYARSGDIGGGAGGFGGNVTEDVIGQIQFEFVDWQERRPASVIMDEIRKDTADIPGIKVEVTAPDAGPPTGKPIQIQLASDYPGRARRGGPPGDRRARQASGNPRPRQRPADAGHRLAAGDRQGARRPSTASASDRSARWCSSSPTA